MPDSPKVARFIDSNIWLYALVEGDDSRKTVIARTVIEESAPVVSTQVINEVCVNLIKKAKFDEDRVGQLIQEFFAKYRVVEMNQTVLLAASALRKNQSLSFWDSMIVASALESAVSFLCSEDMHHGLNVGGQLQIVNPFVTN